MNAILLSILATPNFWTVVYIFIHLNWQCCHMHNSFIYGFIDMNTGKISFIWVLAYITGTWCIHTPGYRNHCSRYPVWALWHFCAQWMIAHYEAIHFHVSVDVSCPSSKRRQCWSLSGFEWHWGLHSSGGSGDFTASATALHSCRGGTASVRKGIQYLSIKTRSCIVYKLP